MSLRVVVIVEGHGEDAAIRTLLERIWYDLLGGDYMEVIPWRGKQGLLRQREGLRPVIEATAIKLRETERTDLRRLLLILLDSEGACPARVAPELLGWAREIRSDTEIACVMPNPMFETWFAAAAVSLRGVNGLPDDLSAPDDPEEAGVGKGWVKRHLTRKYKETVDQAKFASRMDLAECRNSSRSFRKLCEELEARLPGQAIAEPQPPPEETPATDPG